jgi:hypothetical protein
VLMHPEGLVRWTGNKIHPLFGGIAELATEAARRVAHDGGDRPVFIVPLVWKLRYLSDVSTSMHRDLLRIERALGLPRGNERSVIERFHALQENILALQADRFGYPVIPSVARDLQFNGADFFDRQDTFRLHLVNDLETRYTVESSDSIDRRIHRLNRAIRAERSRLRSAGEPRDSERIARVNDDIARVEEAVRLGGFSRDVYGTPSLTQEQIAESLKRIRAALVRRGTKNMVHNYLPRPYGARVAHVRVPDPIRIDAHRAAAGPDERAAYVAELLEQTRASMQAALDAINAEFSAEIAALSHPNPFVAP